MPVEVRLPQLADAMTAAKLGTWLKREGDAVKSGEPIVEVETDKTQVEIEAPASGVLGPILVPAGADSVVVGAVLTTIIESREDRPAPAAGARAAAPPSAPKSVEVSPSASAPTPAQASTIESSAASQAASSNSDSVNVTPVARKIARLAGVDLATIQPANGSRITKADVEGALGKRRVELPPVNERSRAPAPASAPIAPPANAGAFEDQPLSTMRRVTAQRLQQAKQTVPHFYLQSDCRVDALMELRSRFNARPNVRKVTVTEILVFVVSRALRRVPLANSAWIETGVRVFDSTHIAVAVNTPAGLITPVIRDAQRKNIVEISNELAALADRARAGALKPDEYTGGTFTLSNLGMFGVTSIVPILNPPQAGILGVGTIEQRPVVTDGQIAIGQILSITLAADHRAIDGATGAEFLGTLRQLIEDPWSALL